MLALALLAAASGVGSCPAPTVHEGPNPLLPPPFSERSRWIRPDTKRLQAVLWSGRAVDGRFSIYAGGRNAVTGTNEKIMWVVPTEATALATAMLRMEWRRGGKSVVQSVGPRPERDYKRLPWPRIYPSILEPPSPGCWKLRLKTGRIKVTMYVIVTPPPTARGVSAET